MGVNPAALAPVDREAVDDHALPRAAPSVSSLQASPGRITLTRFRPAQLRQAYSSAALARARSTAATSA
jgi:hypothetical protein